MNYVKNFEAPSPRFLSVPFVMLLVAIMAVVAFSVGMPWWGWMVVMVAGVFGGPYLAHKEYEPIRAAEGEYLSHLKSCSLSGMAKVVNDPNRPERTRALIRYHLNESHPGWHEQLGLTASAKC